MKLITTVVKSRAHFLFIGSKSSYTDFSRVLKIFSFLAFCPGIFQNMEASLNNSITGWFLTITFIVGRDSAREFFVACLDG